MQTSTATLGVVAIIYVVMAIVTEAKSGAIEHDIDHPASSEKKGRFIGTETTASNIDDIGGITQCRKKQWTLVVSNSTSRYRTEEKEAGEERINESTLNELTTSMNLEDRESLIPRDLKKDHTRQINAILEDDHRGASDPVQRSGRGLGNVDDTIGSPPTLEHLVESSSRTNDVFTDYDARSVTPAVVTLKIDSLEDPGIHVGTVDEQSRSLENSGKMIDRVDLPRIETFNDTRVSANEVYEDDDDDDVDDDDDDDDDEEEEEEDGKKKRKKKVNTESAPLMSEKMAVEDIRAISFQVPPVKIESAKVDDRPKYDLGTKKQERIADHSSSQPGSQTNVKSTKAFYEIKPSVNTETDRADLQETITRRNVGKFVMPSVASAVGKFGPYFEDGEEEKNVTARIGSTVLLDCKIGMLGDKMVTWLQHSKDSIRLLTVGRKPYSLDQRISLKFRYPSNWRLQIMYASLRDSGLYKCQVATHPPLVKKINVIVTAPFLTIVDDAGRIVAGERHLKAGSALKLKCEARDVLESQNESVVWTRGDETLTEDVSENKTTDGPGNEGDRMIVSTVFVEKASPRHAGNYSCAVPGRARTTVIVHVLNGELPAAVHDGNGASRAVLNLWLIHLTVSYVFSR